jgi:hypothetical protein
MKERMLDVLKWGLIIVIAGAVFYIIALLLKSNPLTILSMWLTALATIAIAVSVGLSYKLASKIQSRDEDFRNQISDLYGAIILSNLLSSDSGKEERKKLFIEAYKGKTPIPLWK